MMIRVKQTAALINRRHAHAGALIDFAKGGRGDPRRLNAGYRRAGLIIAEDWSEPFEPTAEQLTALRADPNIEIETVG